MDTTLVSYEPPLLVERLAHKRSLDSGVANGLSKFIALPTGYKQPGHSVIRDKNSERIVKLSFAEDLQVRFCVTSGKNDFFFQRDQPLIDREDLAKTHNITIYVMTGSIGVENSHKEFLYTAHAILDFDTADRQ